MKRIVLLIMVLILGSGWWINRISQPENKITTPLPSPTPTVAPTSLLGLAINETALLPIQLGTQSYRAAWVVIDHPDLVRIGINPDLASGSGALAADHQCPILTSAAFYDTQNQPMGLLVSGGRQLSEYQQNQLFNGVMGWHDNELHLEEDEAETRDWQWAVQAGPVIWRQGNPVTLRLKTDQSARRVMMVKTTTGKLVLITMVAEDSLFGGPTLAEVPELLTVVQPLVGEKFADGLNLDGGTASAYLTSAVALKELKPIGSYICAPED